MKNVESYDSIIDAFDDVVDAGLDEGVMGWGSFAKELDADFLEAAIADEKKFEELLEVLKPHIQGWLHQCVENFNKCHGRKK